MQELYIQYLPIQDIKPYANNPRDNAEAVKLVMASIQAFGFLNPIVVDKQNVIVCGHTRYEAALRLGIQNIPTIDTGDLSEEQVRAFRLADNKVAQMAIWDVPLLDATLQMIETMQGEQIDMTDFGFSLDLPQIDVVEEEEEEPKDPATDGRCTCPACGYKFKPKKADYVGKE